MKRVISAIVTLCLSISLGAQDLATKIPYDASIVAAIKGRNVTDLMAVSEFSDSKMGQMIGKELNRKTDGRLTSFEDLGLDLQRNFYYFLETKEGVYNNVFMMPMNNTENFLTLLRQREQNSIVTEGNLSYFQDEYDGTITIWNKNTLMIIFSEEISKTDYYDDYSYYEEAYPETEITESAANAVEEAADAIEVEEVVIESVEIEETVIEETEIEETVFESTEVEETVIESTETVDDYYDSAEYKRKQAEREKRNAERERKREADKNNKNAATLQRAKEILNNNASKSVLKNPSYLKSIGKGKDEAVVWVNDVGQIYSNLIPNYSYLTGLSNPYEYMDAEKLYGGMSITGKLNFEKDQTAFRYNYTMNDELAKLYKPMYEGEFNKSFLNYINEDKLLGYISLNTSVEGTLKAYPELIDMIFKSNKDQDIASAVEIGSRLFSLLIDEAGVAKVIRGDMMLLVTDLSEKEVTYTDYEYDEDYNYTKVEKTKTETIPDFLFMFTSEEEKLFHNLMKVGIREAGIEYNNGLYQASGKTTKFPLDLYFMFKDDAVFVGSSKQDLMSIQNGNFVSKVSSGMKKDIIKNAASMYVNGANIVAKIPTEAYPRGLRNEIGLITNNTKDLKINMSKVKGNGMSGEMILKTPTEGHDNSFAYFIHMIDELMD